jgi:hypothetical protein
MNKLIKRDSTAIVSNVVRDPFEIYADSIRPGYIVGKLLKFSKGDYLLGEGAELVAQGTVVVAAMNQLLTGWIRWESAMPTEHRMVLVASGQIPSRRDDLGYLDQSKWETDNDGKPRDPWQYSAYLPVLSEAGDLWTFSTSSTGGHGAIGILPRISLKGDSYLHRDRSRGRIKTPLFELAGWEAKDRIVKALAEAGLTMDELPTITADRSDDMDDDIPF